MVAQAIWAAYRVGYHSTDLLVVHGTSGSTSYETIPLFVRLESSGDVQSTVDMVVQRRDGPRRLREHDDDDDDDDREQQMQQRNRFTNIR